jgi:DMSO/TMAO reductase YedYZ heme-binding membrane subunit
MLLAAGEALLAIDNPGATHSGAGSTLSLLLVTLASLIISIVMLRSDVFSRTIAVVGLVAEGFQLGHFIALAFAPAMLAFPASLAAPLRLAWYILIARRLLKIASGVSEEQAQ